MRLVVIASLAVVLGCTSTSGTRPSATEAEVVASLYKDFAWQAFTSQHELFGKGVADQDLATLERYFAPELASLLLQDVACKAKTQGICNLDFDLLFDSQDPRIADLHVARIASGMVAVEFIDPVTYEKTELEFRLELLAGKWKIIDIRYQRNDETSLREILSRSLT